MPMKRDYVALLLAVLAAGLAMAAGPLAAAASIAVAQPALAVSAAGTSTTPTTPVALHLGSGGSERACGVDTNTWLHI